MRRQVRTPPPGDEYEVGYGKPPKATRFRPGQSGNPNGRPKGKKNVGTILEETLYQPVPITENGKARKVPAIEALFKTTMMNAMKGDHRAADRLLKQVALFQQMKDAAVTGEAGSDPDPAEDRHVLASFVEMLKEAGLAEGHDDEA